MIHVYKHIIQDYTWEMFSKNTLGGKSSERFTVPRLRHGFKSQMLKLSLTQINNPNGCLPWVCLVYL